MRSSRISKIIFTATIFVGSIFPFLQYYFARSSINLVIAISLSLLITFGYLILFLFQLMPSFASAEPYSLLLTLPFEEKDYEFVTLFSFVRMFDAQVATAMLTQVIAIAVLTSSVEATLLMIIVSSINVVFAITISVLLARVFYKNMTRGGRSLFTSISRVLFLLAWGIAAMSLGLSFDFITYLGPYVNAVVSGTLSGPSSLFLSFVHPFSAGIVITSIVYPNVFSSSLQGNRLVLAYLATGVYVMIGVFAARKTIGIVSTITHGQGVNILRSEAKVYGIKTKRPILAYMIKDLRLATKSPSTAFLFAFPVFEVIILTLATNSSTRFSATTVFSSMIIGLFFIMIVSSVLLNTEASALDFTLSLPVSASTIVNAKALIVGLTFLPIPIAMMILETQKSVTSPILALVPFIEVFAVISASMSQVSLFLVSRRKASDVYGSRSVAVFQPKGFSVLGGRDVLRLVLSLVLGIALLSLPIVSYGTAYILTHDHFTAVIAMAFVASVEFMGAEIAVRA
ncbi:MAG: hypothetical protein ACYCQJ_00195 [Nitrososphaerales archaeon]